MAQKIALLFPGQGSQTVGMLQELLESSDIVKKYMVGMLFSQGDETSLTLEIQKIYRDQSLLSEFKGNAIKASRHFDRKMMAEKMLSVFVETGVKINSRFHRGL